MYEERRKQKEERKKKKNSPNFHVNTAVYILVYKSFNIILEDKFTKKFIFDSREINFILHFTATKINFNKS